MKGLNKLALATAVAAAPFATQAMEPMSDEAMGNTTGQAGVTIELQTNMSIDTIEYSQGDTGSFLVNDLTIGGTNLADTTDGSGNVVAEGTSGALDLDMTVDLAGANDTSSTHNEKFTGDPTTSIASFGATNRDLNEGDAIISVGSLDGRPVDLSMNMGQTNGDAMQLTGADGTATLVSEVSMNVYLSQLDIIARAGADGLNADGTLNTGGTGTGSGALQVDALFSVADLDAKIDVAAVGIRDMRIGGNVQPGSGDNTLDTLSADTTTEASFLDPATVAPAVVSMNIGSGESLSGNVTDSLRISLDTFQADMYIGAIGIGNEDATTGEFASIGSLGIDNLQITNTEVAIYGRD